jgi:hypothetical protein
MKRASIFLLSVLLVSVPAFAGGPKNGTPPGHSKQSGTPPGLSQQNGVPPGLAKKGGLPPGIAKKFGAKPPAVAYIAIDPRHVDQAWFLIDNRWTLKKNFDATLKLEIGDALKLPSIKPPIPLPKLPDPLHVISFR